MKNFALMIAATLIASVGTINAQTLSLPRYVVDHGGGTSAAGGVTLRGSIGQPAAEKLTAASVHLEEGYVPGLRYFTRPYSALDVAFTSGWNMVSVPFMMSDTRKSILFPAATSNAFLYQGSYAIRDTLKNSVGYWVKFATPGSSHFAGTPIMQDTIVVADKWNMIGCISFPLSSSDIMPLDSVSPLTNYWGYSNGSGYFYEDTLKPGRAYWVKVHNSGRMVLMAGSSARSRAGPATGLSTATAGAGPTLNTLNKLLFRDALGRERSLYFSTKQSSLEPDKWEIPPIPFEGVMDARFGTNRILEVAASSGEKEFDIAVSQAEYPLTVSWELKESGHAAKFFAGSKEFLLDRDGNAVIPKEGVPFKLLLAASADKELPGEYILRHNYPNPFNPSTTIRYELPKETRVTLRIYDILGREVETLADEVEPAGFRSIVWSAFGFASGVYIARLESEPLDGSSRYVANIKMLLMK